MSDDFPPARLYLVSPVLGRDPDAVAALTAALGSGDVACVLVRHAGRDERTAKGLLREVAALVQDSGAALLVEADPRLAAHVKADGIHVPAFGEALEEAVERLKPDGIVGCGGFASRDDAMSAGELDIDYLMFGEPAADGTSPDPAWTLERVQWWAEIFNIPCVGYAQSLEAVGPIALAGAEFVALGEAVFADPRGPAAAIGDAMTAIEAAAKERAAV